MVVACVSLLPCHPSSLTPAKFSGHPIADCHAPGQFDLPFDPTRRTFGFVTNTARGELSVIDMDNSKLVDLDPANADTNVAPLGVLPEQIAASDDGCRIVSANRGSCDLTMVDVGTLVAPWLNQTYKTNAGSAANGGSLPPSSFSQQVMVKTVSHGRLMVAPNEVL